MSYSLLLMSHNSTRPLPFNPDAEVRNPHSVNGERVCECMMCVCVSFCYNLHSDLIWSDPSWALLRSEMIGNALCSLRGGEQPARNNPHRPPTLRAVVRRDELIRYTSSGWARALLRASRWTMSPEAILISPQPRKSEETWTRFPKPGKDDWL